MGKIPPFEAIRPAPTLSEQVRKVLGDHIAAGVLAEGQSLPSEQAMAGSFGVSRVVIREAISRLKAEGLVVTRKGLGAFVAPNARQLPFKLDHPVGGTVSELLQIVELRIGFEVEVAGLAAMRRTPQQLAEMERALREMEEAIVEGRVGLGVSADFDFHRAICTASANRHYLSFFNFLSQFLRDGIAASRRNSARREGVGVHAQAEHEAIFEAIAAGDAAAARAAARSHVENTAQRLMRAETERLAQPLPSASSAE